MVAVRERIRINGKPIEEDLFAKYFWEVWDKLEADPKVSCFFAFERFLEADCFFAAARERTLVHLRSQPTSGISLSWPSTSSCKKR
jgi:hypothetical protein